MIEFITLAISYHLDSFYHQQYVTIHDIKIWTRSTRLISNTCLYDGNLWFVYVSFIIPYQIQMLDNSEQCIFRNNRVIDEYG